MAGFMRQKAQRHNNIKGNDIQEEPWRSILWLSHCNKCYEQGYQPENQD